MAKSKGLTILLDEDTSAAIVVEFLEWKGYKVERVPKGDKDHQLRPRLGRRPRPLFMTKDRGWLKAGAVPKRHGGVVVFGGSQLSDVKLLGLVAEFVGLFEANKKLVDAVLDRRFLSRRSSLWEYYPDGSRSKLWPRE